jgi:hypothetical protein|tara:strand:+ start:90 stop:275 length:186 start_codon:yes stop_codon:yes gene_type:complete
MVDFQVKKNDDLNLYEGTMTVSIPEISVTRFKADRNDFKYEMRRAISEIVEELIEKNFLDE